MYVPEKKTKAEIEPELSTIWALHFDSPRRAGPRVDALAALAVSRNRSDLAQCGSAGGLPPASFAGGFGGRFAGGVLRDDGLWQEVRC